MGQGAALDRMFWEAKAQMLKEASERTQQSRLAWRETKSALRQFGQKASDLYFADWDAAKAQYGF